MTDQVNEAVACWVVRRRRTGRIIWSDKSKATAEGYARQIAHRMPDNSLDTEVLPFRIPADASADLAAHPSRGVVDDAMVERARLAYYETKKFTWNGQVMNPKECMKAGLEAALAATSAHDQPEGADND